MLKYLLIPFFLIAAAPALATTLKIATLAPDGTAWMKSMRAGAAEISERTEGRVKLRFYPGGVMGNDQSVLRKIRVGQLQGAALTAGGLSTVYPDIQLYSLPFLFRDTQEVDKVRQNLDPVLIAGLRGEGYISYGLSESGFAYLMSQQALDGVEALRQRRIWTPEGDHISLEAFRAIDIAPVPLPLTDVMTGLQTGLIDTVASSPVGAIALQWHTRIKQVADIPLTYLYGSLVISEKALNRITASDRQILDKVLRHYTQLLNRQNREDNQQARKALMSEGIQFYQPMQMDPTPWKELIDKVTQHMRAQNRLDPKLTSQLYTMLAELRRDSTQ